MPKLRQYVSSSPKTGFYVHANVGGGSPITLQVSPLGSKIFRENGYREDDVVPTKLVWAMYDVGFLFTQKSQSDPDVDTGNIYETFIQHEITANLSPGTKRRLIKYLSGYEGPQKSNVNRLRQKLEKSADGQTLSKSRKVPPASYPETTTDGVSLFFTWSESVDQFKNNKNHFERNKRAALRSVQTFYSHPQLSKPNRVRRNGSVAYTLHVGELGGQVELFDVRNLDFEIEGERYDYKLKTDRFGGETIYYSTTRLVRWTRAGESISPDGREKSIVESVIPELSILNRIPSSIAETIEPVKVSAIASSGWIDPSQILIGTVDRISNNSNPIVELQDGHILLDRGAPGKDYLIHRESPKHGRVLMQVKKRGVHSDSTPTHGSGTAQ